ncbi:DUF5690 family protein [Chondrinema litorale]|uniref:DUF5690 family protein n=1 Tax=Chondrinema litorale TaxID=2994555 RepID=UPI002543D34B|nr:DUF5690 family protein [Chondrinema litorale]UZR97490.1 DUF5690 family protein [Chondrinema litorale]
MGLKIAKVSISKTDLILLFAAFAAYTGMYAVRKAFLAAQFDQLDTITEYHFKTILVIAQVLGYMLSKFIGIKVVAEVSPAKRFTFLISLVGFGLLMLLLFAIVPLWLKPVTLFLNGLPLGMVFGLVLSYLEGRRNSELLVAGLSATFIFSTGLVKSTGLWLMQSFQVNEYAMPFITGLLFFPIFILAVWFLHRSKKPTSEDIEQRTERIPMDKTRRLDFLQKHGAGFFVLVLIYIILTVIRDFRDNFIVEFWAELGLATQPELITITEIPVTIIVLVISALGILILNNKTAFNLGIYATIFSALLMLVVTYLFEMGKLSPVIWIVASGTSIYLPYILFHCLLFERFIALLKYRGTVSYLFYVADALGYLASVGILLMKEQMNFQISWVNFFINLNMNGAFAILLVCVIAILVLQRKQKLFFAREI